MSYNAEKVHFGKTTYCLPQWLKSLFFEKKFKWSIPEGDQEYNIHEEKIKKTLILVFEVIMQPPKYTFCPAKMDFSAF